MGDLKLGKKGILLIGLIIAFFIAISLFRNEDAGISEVKITGTQTAEIKEMQIKEGLKERAKLEGLDIGIGEIGKGKYSIKVLKRTIVGDKEVISFEPVTKIYKKIYLEVFNPTSENRVFKSIKLIDNLGNEYASDSNPDSSAPVLEFGRDNIISPSTRRKGYLFFLEVNEKAKSLELILELESGAKKTIRFKN